MISNAHDFDSDLGVSLMARDQYMREVSWLPRLTDEERQPLLERIERGKMERLQVIPDEGVLEDARQARAALVESFQRLVIFLAQRWVTRFRGMDVFDDLIQEGNLGLLHMIEHYTLTELDAVWSVAAACIRHALSHWLRDRETVMRLPGNVVEAINKVRCTASHLSCRFGREPTLVEIAQEMKVSEGQVREWMVADRQMQVESLSLMLDDGETQEQSEDGGYVVMRCLYPSVESAESARRAEVEVMIEQGLTEVLSERQRQVVSLYYGLDGEPHTHKRIAEVFGVTDVAIRQMRVRAEQKLSTVLTPWYGDVQEGMVA